MMPEKSITTASILVTRDGLSRAFSHTVAGKNMCSFLAEGTPSPETPREPLEAPKWEARIVAMENTLRRSWKKTTYLSWLACRKQDLPS